MSSDIGNLLVLAGSIAGGLCMLWLGYMHFSYRKKRLGSRAVVSALYIYPVKSCAGVKLDQMKIEKLGPFLDRSWLLVNAKGIFQTLRQIPKLALVRPSFEGTEYLCLDAPDMPALKLDIDIDESKAEKREFDIFSLHGEGLDCGDEAGKWFDEFLGKEGYRLFNGHNKMLKRRELKEDARWLDTVKEDDQCIYPDEAPVMMVSEASLETVNQELDSPVDIRSFRPNIFIQGCLPFEEDSWNSVRIGDVLLRKLKHCSRCVLITVDPDSGTKRPSGEPLKTLKRIRVFKDMDKRYNKSPLFGMLFVADKIGTVSVGDEVIAIA